MIAAYRFLQLQQQVMSESLATTANAIRVVAVFSRFLVCGFLLLFWVTLSAQGQSIDSAVRPKTNVSTNSKKANPRYSTRGRVDFQRPADAKQFIGTEGSRLVPEKPDRPSRWVFQEGVLTASPTWDSLLTPEPYQDFRLHLEFNVNDAGDVPRERNGNSGIYIQQRYELQILNSYGVPADEYKKTDCSCIYQQKKPDQLVCKPAGQWQSFDIVFRAARFHDGKKIENARITVYQNETLIHDDYELKRKTGAGKPEGPEPMPIKLQGHHNQVQFRNFWIQRLAIGPQGASIPQSDSLTAKLKQEPPAKLVDEARTKGDLVRGAILFHQGNINCAKCHRATESLKPIGPDLSRIDKETTDVELLESILEPSKVIRKGYESQLILMEDGRVLTGQVLKQDEQQLVFRDKDQVERTTTLLLDDIEMMRPNEISLMPADLIDQLESRQHFLDLLGYVLNVRDRGPVEPAVTNMPTDRRTLSQIERGLIQLQEQNCLACHQGQLPTQVTAKQAPNLHWSSNRVHPEYMTRFILSPDETKPGTTMPRMLNSLPAAERQASAEALAGFIASLSKEVFRSEPIDVEQARRGQGFFHSVGCVACHAPRDAEANEQAMPESQPLGDLSGKYNVSGLTEFLKDPHVVRPAGRMPQLNLTHFEATDIAHYLLQTKASSPEVPPAARKATETEVKQGRSLFISLGCAACHQGVIPEPEAAAYATRNAPKPLTWLAKTQAQNPDSLDSGCLAQAVDSAGKHPRYAISSEAREQMAAALASLPEKLSSQQQIDISLTAFNCTACHDRSGLGGVSSARMVHFQTTNMNLGEQGRIPPTLSNVGAKLKADWLREVLTRKRSIRPYMKTRMPQFGEPNIGHLVDLFQKSDSLPPIEHATFKDQKTARETGWRLAGNKGLNCVACHTYQYKLSDTMPAVDTTEMTDRLKKDWFYHYMLAPQSLSPNTVMPSFWPNGVAIRKDLEGDAKDQIEALWQYLLDGRQARAPSGIVRERLEIVVSNEARMLRRSYPGIGKRGIGVGYPGGINLAFDAEQMRLGMIWKGKFADPGGVWTGQGSGTVRPMGAPLNFPRGPDLDHATSPWKVDDGRPPTHQFRGYELDAQQRPTFEYSIESTQVKDFFWAHVDQKSKQTTLRRKLTILPDRAEPTLRFRVASQPALKQIDERTFEVGKRLTLRILGDQQAMLTKDDNQPAIIIPVETGGSEPVEIAVEYDWK